MQRAIHVLPSEDTASAADRGATVSQIVQALEEDILFGLLHPRERLIENDLIERFQAKRHVVREALAQLDRIGLVERPPGRSVTVKDVQPAEVEQIYAMRELLETAAAAWMPLPLERATLERIIEIQHRHDAAAAAKDIRAMFRINIEFHQALFAHCGNHYLSEQIELMGKKAHAVRSFSITKAEHIESARRDHWQIIRALQKKDRAKLVSLCREHIRVSKDAYIEAYQSRFLAQHQPA
ncbi:MAG TPA: GntR family transcriptional regulator [Ramlibacter sp.]|jgi:DNA-binding GntR family transcriptional regulator|nr:GntR family transcriptional regulator [Ramlibacter sp.]